MTEDERKKQTAARLRAWKLANPEKVRAYNKKWRDNNRDHLQRYQREYQARNIERYRALWATYRARKRASRAPAIPFGELLGAALSSNALWAKANGAVSRSLPDHARDDIVSEIVLAVLEGKMEMEHINEQASRFVRSYWAARDLHKTVSIDSTINGTDGLTYLDVLSDERI